MNPEQKRENIGAVTESEETSKEKILPYTYEYKEKLSKFFEALQIEAEREEISDSPNFKKNKKHPDNFWIATDEGGNVVGTVGINDCGGKLGYLKSMYVKKELRSKGLGAKLLHESTESIKKFGYQKVFLATRPDNVKAQKFYTKNGFCRVETPPPSKMTFHQGTVFFEMDLEKEPK